MAATSAPGASSPVRARVSQTRSGRPVASRRVGRRPSLAEDCRRPGSCRAPARGETARRRRPSDRRSPSATGRRANAAHRSLELVELRRGRPRHRGRPERARRRRAPGAARGPARAGARAARRRATGRRPPPSRAASRAHWPGDAVADLAELPEDVAPVRVERRWSPCSQIVAARSEVLEAGPRVAEDHERAGSSGRPSPSASERRTRRLRRRRRP